MRTRSGATGCPAAAPRHWRTPRQETLRDRPVAGRAPGDREPRSAASAPASRLAIAAHLALEPGPRQPPVAHHGCGRHLQDGSRLLDAQPAEEPHLDDAALPLVEFRQCLKGVVQADEVLARFLADDECFVEGYLDGTAAALLIVPGARVIDQDAAHYPRGDGEKVRAVVPLDRLPVHQPDKRLVDERGRLQAVSHALSCHAASRNAVELIMDERDQPVQGAVIASSPSQQEPGDLRILGSDAAILGRPGFFFSAINVPSSLPALMNRRRTT